MKRTEKIKQVFPLLFLFLGGLIVTSGCSDDFLDQKNPQAIGFDQIDDLKKLTTASVGVYNYLQQSDYYNRTFILTPELIGDNVMISRDNSGRYLNHDNLTIGTGDGYVTGAWSMMYKVIVNANLALAAGNKIEFAPEQQVDADNIMGELYALRALAYFDLVRFFAQPYNFTEDASHLGVPIITEPENVIISPPRASVAEVYAQIIADLTEGERLMKLGKNNGHFNNLVAQALLSKVYLYMEDWANAEHYATKVIESGAYTLLANAAYVDSWALKFTGESIFEVSNLPTENSGVNGIGYFTEQGGYGDAIATQDLYDTYTATDVRRELLQRVRRTPSEIGYAIEKYPNGVVGQDDNPKVLRLAEIYLIRAEARAELGKTDPSKIEGARQDLNLIIKRADPEASDITSSGAELVNRIILERRKELAFEGNRLFDLNRKKMNIEHIQSDQTRTFTYPNNRFIMPIPYSEKNANDNIIQNPGWN